MVEIVDIIMTGGILGWGLFVLKSLCATSIEKIFMPKWKFVITEGIFGLFLSLILGVGIVSIINVKSFEGTELLVISRMLFILTSIWIVLKLYIFNRPYKWNLFNKIMLFFNKPFKWKNFNDIMVFVFSLSSIISFSLLLNKEVSNKEFNENFIGYFIVTWIFCFLVIVIVLYATGKTKFRYKVKIYGDKDKLNELYFVEAIDENRHIYLPDIREQDNHKKFYLYYLNEGKIYKYERVDFIYK